MVLPQGGVRRGRFRQDHRRPDRGANCAVRAIIFCHNDAVARLPREEGRAEDARGVPSSAGSTPSTRVSSNTRRTREGLTSSEDVLTWNWPPEAFHQGRQPSPLRRRRRSPRPRLAAAQFAQYGMPSALTMSRTTPRRSSPDKDQGQKIYENSRGEGLSVMSNRRLR